MSAVTFTPGVFYEVMSRTSIPLTDVETIHGPVDLGPGDVVRCSAIVHRKGGKGRGRYAKLHVRRLTATVVCFHRVSRNNIGSGDWEELNEMAVLALADVLPLD